MDTWNEQTVLKMMKCDISLLVQGNKCYRTDVSVFWPLVISLLFWALNLGLIHARQIPCQLSYSPSLLFTNASLSSHLLLLRGLCVLHLGCLCVFPFLPFLGERIKNWLFLLLIYGQQQRGFPDLTQWLHVLCLVFSRCRKHTGHEYWHCIYLCFHWSVAEKGCVLLI